MFQSFINRFQTLTAARRDALACLLLVLAVFAAYSNVYNYDFLLDDQSLIITNVYLRSWSHLPDIFKHLNYAGSGAEKGFYRPVEMTLRLITYQLFGQSRPAFHALNIIIHVLNTVLVYWLGRKLNLNAGAVFAATLLWCLHPLFTQEITYMSSTSELLWTTFSLLALVTLLPDFKLVNVCIALVFIILGFGSKETTVVFPAMATACLFVVSKDRLKLTTYIKTWPFWLLSAIYAAVYVHMNSYRPFESTSPDLDAYAHHILPRILTSLATLPMYLGLVIYPHHLHMERVFPVYLTVSWQVLTGAAMVAGALAQIFLGKGKRGLALSFGFVWFAAAISPVTGIIIPVDAMVSEGWIYTPCIGLFLGVAQTVAVWLNGLKSKQASAIAVVAVVIAATALGTKTYVQNKVFKNPETFYFNIFDCGGYRTRAYPDLGIFYLNRHDFDNSAKYFELAVQYPNERNVPSAAIHTQLALAYLRVTSDDNYMVTPEAVTAALPTSTKIPEAINELNLALRIDPDFYFAHTLLSAIYRWQGDNKAADFHYQQMIGILRKMGKVK